MHAVLVSLPASPAPRAEALAQRLNALPAPEGSRWLDFAARTTRRGRGGGAHQPAETELLGVFETPEPALAAAAAALREPEAVVALGTGGVVWPQTWRQRPQDLSGPALGHARAALAELSGTAPARRAARAVHAAGEDAVLAQAVTALLHLVARGIRERTPAQWRVVDLLVPGVRGQHAAVARSLGISTQAVSRTLIRTGWHEEQEALGAAAALLVRADQDGPGTD